MPHEQSQTSITTMIAWPTSSITTIVTQIRKLLGRNDAHANANTWKLTACNENCPTETMIDCWLRALINWLIEYKIAKNSNRIKTTTLMKVTNLDTARILHVASNSEKHDCNKLTQMDKSLITMMLSNFNDQNFYLQWKIAWIIKKFVCNDDHTNGYKDRSQKIVWTINQFDGKKGFVYDKNVIARMVTK